MQPPTIEEAKQLALLPRTVEPDEVDGQHYPCTPACDYKAKRFSAQVGFPINNTKMHLIESMATSMHNLTLFSYENALNLVLLIISTGHTTITTTTNWYGTPDAPRPEYKWYHGLEHRREVWNGGRLRTKTPNPKRPRTYCVHLRNCHSSVQVHQSRKQP